jgi:small-conductance mechanosensitive channel
MANRPTSVVVNDLYDAFKRAEAEVDYLNSQIGILRERIESSVDDPARAVFFLEQIAVSASTASAAIGWLPDNLKAIGTFAAEVLDQYQDEDARRQFEIDEHRRLVEVSKEFL